jgi:hypothetical protein
MNVPILFTWSIEHKVIQKSLLLLNKLSGRISEGAPATPLFTDAP